jgi:hypothetical protein
MFPGLMRDERQKDGIVAHRKWRYDLQGSTNQEMTSLAKFLDRSRTSHVWRAHLREAQQCHCGVHD